MQPPTIYRIFGDKEHLLHAVVERGCRGRMEHPRFARSPDRTGRALCDRRTEATQLIHAAGSGTALSLIALPHEQRDMSLSSRVRDAIIATITQTDIARSDPEPKAAAITLRANLAEIDALTASECQLMNDWLERIIRT